MIRLPNLIIPFGTQHRPNAAWIMEAGSSFQLCSIDFWQVCSYRWLCFSIMIIEISVKKSLGFFFFFFWVVGMEQIFCSTSWLLFSILFFFRFFFLSTSTFMFDIWEVIDALSVYNLYNIFICKTTLSSKSAFGWSIQVVIDQFNCHV